MEGTYWRFIADTWRALGQVLSEGAHVVFRIGSRKIGPDRLQTALTGASRFSGRKVRLVSAETSEIRNRQTRSFRPGTTGVAVEVDCHYKLVDAP